MKQKLIKLISMILLFALCIVPSTTYMAEARSSNYLTSYGGYVYDTGSKIQVWFTVTGTSTMEDIGAYTINLYVSSDGSTWVPVKTFNYVTYTNMMAHNTNTHGSNVDYTSRQSGMYYRAKITVYAAKGGGCDSRIYTTAKIP